MQISKQKQPRNLLSKIIQYCLVILPLLAVMLFALERFFSSHNIILNILLGGFFCILIQLYIFSKLFWSELKQHNFNIIKTIIYLFNKFWGDKSPSFVEYRNQKKYYIPLQLPTSNLFKPKGQFVYTKVMTQLRGRMTVDYMPKIKQIQTKCQYVEQRTSIIQRIYEFIVKDYSHTAKGLLSIIHNLRKQIPQFQQEDFLKEHNLLSCRLPLISKIEQNIGLPLTPKQSSFIQSVSWHQTLNMISLIGNSFHKTQKQINEMCYKLISQVSVDVKSAKNTIIQRLRGLYSSQKKGQSDCIQLVNRRRQLQLKVQEMESKLEKVKKKQQYETQLNLELEIKINKAEVSSLNVKLWNLKDINTIQSQQLYNECQKSQNSIINLENTLQSNAQTLFKTFLETGRHSTYQKIKYIRKIIEKHQINPDETFYHSVESDHISFRTPVFDIPKFNIQYRRICQGKSREALFYKTFIDDICQVYEKRLIVLETNYQMIERQLMRVGGILRFQRLTMKHFYGQIESTKDLVTMIRDTQRAVRIKALKFQQNIENWKRREGDIMARLKKKSLSGMTDKQKSEIAKALWDILVGLQNVKIQDNSTQLEFIFPFTALFMKSLESVEQQINIMEQTNQNAEYQESQNDKKFRQYFSLLSKIGQTQSTVQNNPHDLSFFNKLIGVFLHDWKDSEVFHAQMVEKLWLPLNRKRPQFLDELVIKYLKIQEIQDQQITKVRIPKSEIFHSIIDFDIMVKGKVGLTIESKIKVNKGIPLLIKSRFNKIHLSVRMAYTPWAVGKSYFSFLSPPQIDVTGQIFLSNWNLSKFPIVGLLVKVFLIRIFKKILVWPMRVSTRVPGSIRDTRAIAIKERLKWQHQQEESIFKWQQNLGNNPI